MATDLELAFAYLTAKKPLYDKFWRYYDGFAPLVYSRERLRTIFKEIDARFTQNWCAVVIDSVLDRIQLRQFTIAEGQDETGQQIRNEAAEEALGQLVEANELTLEADSVHLASLVTGEAFVVAWPDEEGIPQAYYNDPRLCHAVYYADNPRRMRFAAKWWQDDDLYVRLTLYYADRLEYYRTGNRVQKTSDVSHAGAFLPFAEDGQPIVANPYETMNVFHFKRERRAIRSELANVIEPQDAINKLLNDMMVAGEFGAFKQRWIITNASTQKLKNAPNEIWRIPPGVEGEQPTSLGEFAETNLGNYITGIDKFANAIAIITRTPKHYFFNGSGDPSGEALIAMEAPLNKKAQKYIDRFAVEWRKLARFMLLLQGTQVELSAIASVFDKPETVQPRTEAEIRQMDVASGIPLATILRDQGWQDSELDQMAKDKATEQQAAQEAAGFNPSETSAMIGAAQRLLQGNG
jgi:hypothetical protein